MMIKKKQLLAAGIVRDFRFGCNADLDLYLNCLVYRRINYVILETSTCYDGSVLVRIVQQYNDVDLIDLT